MNMKTGSSKRLKRLHGAIACNLLAIGCTAAVAQQARQVNYSSSAPAVDDAAALPDAPSPTVSSSAADAPQSTTGSGAPATDGSGEGKQTKRILGIVPNFRSVSADQKLPPQTVKDKFKTTLQDNFDYSSFIFVGALAGVAMAENSYPQFHQGAAGYGRYYWHSLADQTSENTFVEFLLPSALHQDSRYYTLGHGGILKRGAYSFSRTLITRGDDGREEPNYSEVVGAGAASGISDLYYPGVDRTWTKTGQRWLTNVILDGATFTVKEFWPDINDHVFHQKD